MQVNDHVTDEKCSSSSEAEDSNHAESGFVHVRVIIVNQN